ncbi:hypothetical protein AVEN_16300-1 [Araneus ventricosus]|uniref:Uncharacterized protein n=1 Tax=Araneus ventricosus TaxID=182803 RepID=A0A4Y2ADV8_ARAVE|nr:hypothetical protein AVEN_16300-1 [Araneus ventricosus]
MQLQMKEISRKAQTLFRQDGYHHHLYYHRGPYINRCWLAYAACILSLSWSGRKWQRHSYIYTWMNSARAELHLFSILHGRIKFHLPPHGKVRYENAKVREAATQITDL